MYQYQNTCNVHTQMELIGFFMFCLKYAPFLEPRYWSGTQFTI